MYKVGYNEHIVNLQGITVSHEDCQFFLVLEYCSKGEMNYFQKNCEINLLFHFPIIQVLFMTTCLQTKSKFHMPWQIMNYHLRTLKKLKDLINSFLGVIK